MPKTKKLLSSEEFFDILRLRTPANAARTDALINSRGLAEMAVLVCDSSGFSKKTHDHGIIEFLDTMVKCHDRFVRIVEGVGGQALSSKADNLIALFPSVESAARAALELNAWLKARNAKVPAYKRYNICSGIDFGPLIRLADDAYGPAVNVAFKVGEDIAGVDEILLTSRAADGLPSSFRRSYAKNVTIGAINFDLYRLTGG
ncbi:MAG: adenylate/guanylate cyclase domain-containing protein [Elusimicrobiota bacterium]